MTWVRIDDQMTNHPKILGMGRFAPLATALQLRALCYASHYLTDGFIPSGVVPSLLTGYEAWGTETGGNGMVSVGQDAIDFDWPEMMCEAGLWKKTKGGYRIHDYLVYNPTKETVLKERAQNRQRQQGFRDRNANRNGVTNGDITPLSQVPPARTPAPSPDRTDTNAEGKQFLSGAGSPAREGARPAPSVQRGKNGLERLTLADIQRAVPGGAA